MGRASISFDRIADRYEASRGGKARGTQLAHALAPHLPDGGRVLEVGVGTGVVASALTGPERFVAGIDLSRSMLELATARLPGALAQADATALPVADESLDAVYLVWVLHLVDDRPRLFAEAHRVLRPGGRLIVVGGPPRGSGDDELGRIERRLQALRTDRDTPERATAWAAAAGLRLVGQSEWASLFTKSPEESAAAIKRREFSLLWDLDERTWREVVEPIIADLRSLPDPDQPRTRRNVQPVLAFEKPAA